MASLAAQLIEEATAHAQSDSLEDEREICADGNYFPNNLSIIGKSIILTFTLNDMGSHTVHDYIVPCVCSVLA